MKKKYVIITCLVLLIWFFLDMIGVKFGDKYLVSQSFSEDGVFFIIYTILVLLFIFKEKIGKICFKYMAIFMVYNTIFFALVFYHYRTGAK